jgi:hypothetical protein
MRAGYCCGKFSESYFDVLSWDNTKCPFTVLLSTETTTTHPSGSRRNETAVVSVTIKCKSTVLIKSHSNHYNPFLIKHTLNILMYDAVYNLRWSECR